MQHKRLMHLTKRYKTEKRLAIQTHLTQGRITHGLIQKHPLMFIIFPLFAYAFNRNHSALIIKCSYEIYMGLTFTMFDRFGTTSHCYTKFQFHTRLCIIVMAFVFHINHLWCYLITYDKRFTEYFLISVFHRSISLQETSLICLKKCTSPILHLYYSLPY